MDRFHAEFRAATSEGRVSGHASVFGQIAEVRGGFERVDPEAFTSSLAAGRNVVLLVNHDGLPLASTDSSTLKLGVDERGLTVDAELPDTTLARDVRELMGRGLLSKMSFGFIPKDDRLDRVEGRSVRTITDLDLIDVSIVTMPAYSDTDVVLRHMDIPRAVSVRGQLATIRGRVLLGGRQQ